MVKRPGSKKFVKPDVMAGFEMSCRVTFQEIGADSDSKIFLWEHQSISFQRSTRNDALIYVVAFSEMERRVRTQKIYGLSKPGTFGFTFELKTRSGAAIAPIRKDVNILVKSRTPETFDTTWANGDHPVFSVGEQLGTINFLGKVNDAPGILTDTGIAALKSSLQLQYLDCDGKTIKSKLRTTKKMLNL